MTGHNYSPLKIGLLIVALSYFLFNLHSAFTLQWIGEWNRTGGSFSLNLLIEDIFQTIGIALRFAAGVVAASAAIFYFSKKLSNEKIFRILRWILVFEGIYWLSLLPTGIIGVDQTVSRLGNAQVVTTLKRFALNELPILVESVAIPIALFVLALKLSPNKPERKAVNWALITGTIYIFVFWLINTSIWIITYNSKGTRYLLQYPQNLFSFIVTIFGLLALGIYSAYFTKKSSGASSFQELKLKTVGGIILAIGIYFLWNYLSWVFFGAKWSDWYAWFLGHNLDLWMLSAPLVGLPLLFVDRFSRENNPALPKP